MTTFIFVMVKSSSRAQQSRVLVELDERFPEHDFLLGDAHLEEYERNIVAVVDGENAAPPDPDQVNAVIAFFRKTLREIEGWKPS